MKSTVLKSFFCIFILIYSSFGIAEQLHDFNQVKSAVAEGKLIRILVDYTKCSSAKEFVANNAAIFTPNAMAMSVDGTIGSYILYFTMKDPRYPGKGVFQYGRYILSNENTVKLIFRTLNAADYTPLDKEESMTCKIDDGAQIFISEQTVVVDSGVPTRQIGIS